MKEFLKLTKLKIGLAIGIFASYTFEMMIYSRCVAHNYFTHGKERANIAVEIIHYIFQTIFIPIDIPKNIFLKLGMYFFRDSDFFYDSDFIYDYLNFIGIVFLLLFIFYCYFLGCIAYFLIKKKGLTLKDHPERK